MTAASRSARWSNLGVGAGESQQRGFGTRFIKKRLGLIALFIPFYLTIVQGDHAVLAAEDKPVVHLSPTGDDAFPGSKDRPVKSFQKALEIARTRELSAEIRFEPGSLFSLAEPIRLDARDSGLRVTGQNATMSGGVPVVDWRAGDDGIWRAMCPVDGKVRELFVNDRRAVHARFPNQGWLRIERSLPDRRSGFTYVSGDLPEFSSANHDLELVFLHDWSISRLPVASLDQQSRTLRTAFPVGSAAPHYAIDNFEQHPRFALEGSVELLDAPGEWVQSGEEILYRPREDEAIDDISATIPRVGQLLLIAPADDGRAPSNIHFEGITFAHCRWDMPSEGYVSSQATMHDVRDGSGSHARVFIPAAVSLSGASTIVFSSCSFAHLGGSGLWIGRGSSDCVVEHCSLTDISGNGINLGEPESEDVAQRITVKDSQVNNCGAQFYGSVGVWIGMADGCVVQDCEIRDLPYTGVSVGWRWDPTPSPCRKHHITGNHIHHVMQVLSDGGGIYTLGRQPGTVLSGNHIHDIPLNAGRAQSNGIFIDEGSTELLVEGNTIHSIAKSPIRFHKSGENMIRRNTLGIRAGEVAFTFNNTDREAIHFEQNRELPDESDEFK